MYQKIDDTLIDNVFQKLTDKYQLRTQRTNFYLAEILFVIYYIIDIPDTVSFIQKNQLTPLTGFIFIMSLVIYIYVYRKIRVCKLLDDFYKKMDDLLTFNPLRILDIYLRGSFFILTIFGAFIYIVQAILIKDYSKLLYVVRDISLLSGFYFAACVPASGKRLRELEKEKAYNLKLEPARAQI